jgi:hypothetical protein
VHLGAKNMLRHPFGISCQTMARTYVLCGTALTRRTSAYRAQDRTSAFEIGRIALPKRYGKSSSHAVQDSSPYPGGTIYMRKHHLLLSVAAAACPLVTAAPKVHAAEAAFGTYGLGGNAFGAGVTPPAGTYGQLRLATITAPSADLCPFIAFSSILAPRLSFSAARWMCCACLTGRSSAAIWDCP